MSTIFVLRRPLTKSRLDCIPNYTPPNNVIIDYKIGATFVEDIVQNYILKTLVPDRLKKDLQNTKLFLDSARCHMTVKVKSTLSENYKDPVFIPPRLTNLLQPARHSNAEKIAFRFSLSHFTSECENRMLKAI